MLHAIECYTLRYPQVLYGMDYTADERQQQHGALRAALLEHLRQAPESRE